MPLLKSKEQHTPYKPANTKIMLHIQHTYTHTWLHVRTYCLSLLFPPVKILHSTHTPAFSLVSENFFKIHTHTQNLHA